MFIHLEFILNLTIELLFGKNSQLTYVGQVCSTTAFYYYNPNSMQFYYLVKPDLSLPEKREYKLHFFIGLMGLNTFFVFLNAHNTYRHTKLNLP